jgi:hypothetical protein
VAFADQCSAKAFFIERLTSQAEKEGIRLSEAERYMLAWSESDPTFAQNPALTRQFENETTDKIFEEKVISLLKRVFDDDLRRDGASKETYQDAYRVLNQGDHYLLVMIKSALGSKLKKWWFF